MNIEHVEKSYQELESDSTLQNLIAQANARYILYNTEESKENFPRYTIKDEQLNILAFKYLNIGCNYFSFLASMFLCHGEAASTYFSDLAYNDEALRINLLYNALQLV